MPRQRQKRSGPDSSDAVQASSSTDGVTSFIFLDQLTFFEQFKAKAYLDPKLVQGLSKKELETFFPFIDFILYPIGLYMYVGVFWCDFGVWVCTMIISHSLDVQSPGLAAELHTLLPKKVAVYFEEATVAFNAAQVEGYFKPFHRLGYSLVAASLVLLYGIGGAFAGGWCPNGWVPLCAALSSIQRFGRTFRRTWHQYQRKVRQISAQESSIDQEERIMEEEIFKIFLVVCPAIHWDSTYLPLNWRKARAEILRCGVPVCRKFLIELLEIAARTKPVPMARVQTIGNQKGLALSMQFELLEAVVNAARTVIPLDLWKSSEREVARKHLRQATQCQNLYERLVVEELGENHGLDTYRALRQVDQKIWGRMKNNASESMRNTTQPTHPESDVHQLASVRMLQDSDREGDPSSLPASSSPLEVERGGSMQAENIADQASAFSGEELQQNSAIQEISCECVCCFERTATIVFSKCGHLTYCKSCRSKALKRELGSGVRGITSFARILRKPLKCPLCRTESRTVDHCGYTGEVFPA